MSSRRSPEVLLLASAPSTLAAQSGYTRLAAHVTGGELIEVRRTAPRNVFEKALRSLLSRYAVTSWYQLASAQLEFQAWRRLQAGFRGVVHMLWGESDLGFIDLICHRRGVPICCTFHGCSDDLPVVIRRPKRLQALSAIIVVSKTQIEYFLEQGVPRDRIFFIPHGISTGHFTPPQSDLPADCFTVLSVGSYRRNFDALRAVCEQLKDDRRFRFEIISSPGFQAKFAGLPNVRFYSGVSDGDLLAAYQRASCLLMTVQASTANNAVLEGLSCGLPIVAEQVGGVAEYLNADCALETRANDVDGLVAALKLLEGNPNLRRKMSAAARRQALTLSWENIGRRTEEVYQSLGAVVHG